MTHDLLKHLKANVCKEPIDLFLASLSFEKRCTSVVDALDNCQPNKSVVVFNEKLGNSVKQELPYFKEKLGVGCDFALIDGDNPLLTADSILEAVSKSLPNHPARIVIDTTTFTRESLLILLRFLYEVRNRISRIEFLYAHAKEYSIGDKNEEKWLSKGIREVRSVLGFPGDLLPSCDNHLVVLLGFEDERALNLVRGFEPSVISLGVGDRGEFGTEPHQDVNDDRCEKLKSVLTSVNLFTFNAYDAFKAKSIIRQQIAKFPGLNAVIAPMNTKISTIGAGLVAIADTSIQICYAQPNIYNYERYSLPDNDYYSFAIDNNFRPLDV